MLHIYRSCGCSATGSRAHAQRSRFRLPFTLPHITGTVPTQISCESVLVKTNPDNYPHCHCVIGPWSPYRFNSYRSSSTCPSGNKYVLESIRRRLSTKCTQQPATQRRTKDVCKWCLHTSIQCKLQNTIEV